MISIVNISGAGRIFSKIVDEFKEYKRNPEMKMIKSPWRIEKKKYRIEHNIPVGRAEHP